VKLDSKSMVILVLAVALVALGAYTLGLKQSTTSDGESQVSHAPNSNLPAAHPPLAETNQTNKKFSHFRVGNRNVKGIAADDDIVWVGTSGGVIRYELKTDNYELFDVASGALLSNGVFHVSKIDKQLFVGTYGGGLSVYTPDQKNWRNYNIPQGLADQFVYDVQKTKNGDLWIATWSGANRVNQGKLDDASAWQTFNLENTQGGLPNDWVYAVDEDSKGGLWFATEKGVAHYANGQWNNWQHSHGLGAAYDIVKDDIRFKSDPSKASSHHARQREEQGLSNAKGAYNPNYVVSLEVDAEDMVWAATWGGGLARFDGKTWKNFTVKQGLPSNHVFMVKLDQQKQLWAGTSHGLVKVNGQGKSFSVMTRKDGLFSDNVFSLANANDGSMWVGSFGGVARLKDAM